MIFLGKPDVLAAVSNQFDGEWVDAANGNKALRLRDGSYVSQRGDGSFGTASAVGPWEAARISGQAVVYRSDVASGPIYFRYSWVETP